MVPFLFLDALLTLLNPIPDLLESLRKVFVEERVLVDLGRLLKERFRVLDELQHEPGGVFVLQDGVEPLEGLPPEEAHALEGLLVEAVELAVGVAFVVVHHLVGGHEGGLVVDQPEGAGAGGVGQVADRLLQYRRPLLVLSAVLEKMEKKQSKYYCGSSSVRKLV